MTDICAILLYRLGHPKKNYKHKQVREKDKKKKIINSNAIVHDSITQMNTNAESISNVSVIKSTLGLPAACFPTWVRHLPYQ